MRLIRLLKHDLAREVASWVGDGIISTEQAVSICSRYGVDYHNRSRRSYGYLVLLGLGYLFVGLALITLIGANWDEIPRAVRMSALVALTLGANLTGLYQFRHQKDSASIGWFFLGGLFYGTSIMLIAQIYHIDEHFPDGIFWWAMGVLPVALLLENSLVMMLAVGLGFVWFFVESSLDFYPALFPVFLAATAWHLHRGRQSGVLFLTLVAGLTIWAEYSLAWFTSDKPGFQPGAENVALGAGLLLAFHGLAEWLEARKEPIPADYGALLGIWVLRFSIIALFVFSFDDPWRELIEANWKMPGLMIALSLALSASALWLVHAARKPLASTAVFALLLIISLAAVMLVENKEYDRAFQFADNLVLVAAGIRLIAGGIRNSISHYFYLGVLTILATGLLRYIDFVGDYIGTSILFAIVAAILLLAAKYWKSSRAGAGSIP